MLIKSTGNRHLVQEKIYLEGTADVFNDHYLILQHIHTELGKHQYDEKHRADCINYSFAYETSLPLVEMSRHLKCVHKNFMWGGVNTEIL